MNTEQQKALFDRLFDLTCERPETDAVRHAQHEIAEKLSKMQCSGVVRTGVRRVTVPRDGVDTSNPAILTHADVRHGSYIHLDIRPGFIDWVFKRRWPRLNATDAEARDLAMNWPGVREHIEKLGLSLDEAFIRLDTTQAMPLSLGFMLHIDFQSEYLQ